MTRTLAATGAPARFDDRRRQTLQATHRLLHFHADRGIRTPTLTSPSHRSSAD